MGRRDAGNRAGSCPVTRKGGGEDPHRHPRGIKVQLPHSLTTSSYFSAPDGHRTALRMGVIERLVEWLTHYLIMIAGLIRSNLFVKRSQRLRIYWRRMDEEINECMDEKYFISRTFMAQGRGRLYVHIGHCDKNKCPWNAPVAMQANPPYAAP